MINYTTGDLLEAKEKVIIHGCNNCGVMGSGVAKQIRAKWPNVFEVYHLKYQVFGLELGSIIPVETQDGKIVVNAITQDGFGQDGQQYVKYDAIEKCFVAVNDKAKSWEVTEIAMPRIGAGLGGGDWKMIEEIITRTAKNYLPIVYDYKINQQ